MIKISKNLNFFVDKVISNGYNTICSLRTIVLVYLETQMKTLNLANLLLLLLLPQEIE